MKGILFSEPLFPLVVNGTKTQTRRIVNPQPTYSELTGINWKGYAYGIGLNDNPNEAYNNFSKSAKSRYKVGETVYLKEPYIDDSDYFFTVFPVHETMGNGNGMLYLYGNDDSHLKSVYGDLVKWKNKLFMPESAARYFIEITGVRVEKLHDISKKDCIREGIIKKGDFFCAPGIDSHFMYEIDAYRTLIDKINGEGTWDSNPYVWVYDFKMLEGRP